jgi:hypothetical protein
MTLIPKRIGLVDVSMLKGNCALGLGAMAATYQFYEFRAFIPRLDCPSIV